jgi:hypothetical protein
MRLIENATSARFRFCASAKRLHLCDKRSTVCSKRSPFSSGGVPVCSNPVPARARLVRVCGEAVPARSKVERFCGKAVIVRTKLVPVCPTLYPSAANRYLFGAKLYLFRATITWSEQTGTCLRGNPSLFQANAPACSSARLSPAKHANNTNRRKAN